DGNAHEPRLERPGGVPAAQAAEDAQEHFLGDVLGVVAVVKEADAQAEHFGLKAFDELTDRVGLAEQTALHQSGFVRRHVPSLRRRLQKDLPEGEARSFRRWRAAGFTPASRRLYAGGLRTAGINPAAHF